MCFNTICHLDAPVGAFYIVESGGELRMEAGFAINESERKNISSGEGVAGQVTASERKCL